jgi:hypothetical protein
MSGSEVDRLAYLTGTHRATIYRAIAGLPSTRIALLVAAAIKPQHTWPAELTDKLAALRNEMNEFGLEEQVFRRQRFDHIRPKPGEEISEISHFSLDGMDDLAEDLADERDE